MAVPVDNKVLFVWYWCADNTIPQQLITRNLQTKETTYSYEMFRYWIWLKVLYQCPSSFIMCTLKCAINKTKINEKQFELQNEKHSPGDDNPSPINIVSSFCDKRDVRNSWFYHKQVLVGVQYCLLVFCRSGDKTADILPISPSLRTKMAGTRCIN